MWKIKKPLGKILFFLFVATVFAGAIFVFDFIKKFNREFILSQEATLKNVQGLAVGTLGDVVHENWSIFHKLAVEKEFELAAVPAFIGNEQKIYYENRIFLSPDGSRGVNQRRLSDKERIWGLKLMNTETGETEVIAVKTDITQNGVQIIAPDGYAIEIVGRTNGIKWNFWNTEYEVIKPADMVVLTNCFPREETIVVSKVVNGRVKKETKKVVACFPYVPYSEYLRQKDLIEAGSGYDKYVVERAFSLLRERGVMSKSFPDKLVADVEVLSLSFFQRLPFLEQMDLTEFTIDPQKAAERVLVILGTNRENAWIYTCNSSDACGWIQFTSGTYRNIRTTYSAAKLISDFKTGAADHVNSMMAAILLIDYNLNDLLKRYGTKILEDEEQLYRALASTYNGSPRHVWKALDADLGKTVINLTKYLMPETHGFLFKWDYLVENDLP